MFASFSLIYWTLLLNVKTHLSFSDNEGKLISMVTTCKGNAKSWLAFNLWAVVIVWSDRLSRLASSDARYGCRSVWKDANGLPRNNIYLAMSFRFTTASNFLNERLIIGFLCSFTVTIHDSWQVFSWKHGVSKNLLPLCYY